jgi:hypothetical protein
MRRLASALTCGALAAGLSFGLCPPAAANAADGTPAALVVRGQILTTDAEYLVFTTGDAVRLGAIRSPSANPQQGLLGRPVRIVIDTRTHLVTSIELDPGSPEAGEIDASKLPRDLVAVDPRTAQAAPGGGAAAVAGQVTVTIEVRVPDDTPPNDDIYLATERTNYNAAELRMNRIDARRWTISLPLAGDTALHYIFTRGSYATVERQRGGGIVTPRALTAAGNAATHDVVARWADTT